MQKPEFKYLRYDGQHICFPVSGNHVGSLQLLARIQFGEPTMEELIAEQNDYEFAKEIYDTWINVGQHFIGLGDTSTDAVCKITFIHPTKELVTWKQINAPEPYLPACGKWTIQNFISMCKSGQIAFI